MLAIFRREVSTYFTSPIGYIFLAVYYFFSGYYFYGYNLYMGTTDMSMVFQALFSVLMFIVPILTMRLLSEDKRQKTDQALLTAPVRLSSIVVGKFLAAFLIFAIGVAMTLVYAVVMSAFAQPDWIMVLGNVLGLLLLGAALISIGLFISSLTENQVVAAVGSFAIMMIIMMLDGVISAISWEWLTAIMNIISFSTRYTDFTNGIFDISNVLFFISVAVIFNFLTVRVLEKKRWS